MVMETKHPRPKSRMRGLHRITLNRALDLVKAVYELGHGDAVPKTIALDKLGLNEGSGSSDMLIAATNYYGLLKLSDERLTPTARAITLVDRESSEGDKRLAAQEALYASEIFSGIVARYTNKPIPIDKIVIDYLVQTHKLVEKDATKVWSVTRSNLEDQGLLQELQSGKRMIKPREIVQPSTKPEDSREEGASNVSQADDDIKAEPITIPTQVRSEKIPTNQISPEFHFNIQIQLPDNATPETYDAIFRSIGKYLLRNGEG